MAPRDTSNCQNCHHSSLGQSKIVWLSEERGGGGGLTKHKYVVVTTARRTKHISLGREKLGGGGFDQTKRRNCHYSSPNQPCIIWSRNARQGVHQTRIRSCHNSWEDQSNIARPREVRWEASIKCNLVTVKTSHHSSVDQ